MGKPTLEKHKEMRRITGRIAKHYASLQHAAEDVAEELDDEDLHHLMLVVNDFGETNCGWDEYASKQVMLDAIKREQMLRRQRAEADRNTDDAKV